VISFDSGSMRVVLRSMNTALATEKKAARYAVAAAGRVLRDAVKQNISLTDHSLADLRREGHPYARRAIGGGTINQIRIHTKGTKSLTNPALRVHKQEGNLLDALQAAPTHGGLGYRVELDPNIAPHAAFVVLGTKVMLPRDVLWATAEAPFIQQKMMTAIVTVLGKKLRTQGGIRFGGGGGGSNPLGVG
jgi:hypothetical protein